MATPRKFGRSAMIACCRQVAEDKNATPEQRLEAVKLAMGLNQMPLYVSPPRSPKSPNEPRRHRTSVSKLLD